MPHSNTGPSNRLSTRTAETVFGNGRAPNAARRRPSKQNKRVQFVDGVLTASSSNSEPSYNFIETGDAKRRRIPGDRTIPSQVGKNVRLVLPDGKYYTQQRNLPAPAAVGVEQLNIRNRATPPTQTYQQCPSSSTARHPSNDFEMPGSSGLDYDDHSLGMSFIDHEEVAIQRRALANKSRNQTRKVAQWRRWNDDVIPSLVEPYLRHQRETQSGRLPSPAFSSPPCQCGRSQKFQITLMHWNCKHASEIFHRAY